ncbi:uncharacterized protein E5676_scaffold177G00610 [Cucumis melo var. makuwa]|uniref:Uncharacterized protein n=1 Tax=Cucumis melo var. makuwa TaxID=1194695 RepID=A0A5D3CL71_CUCMM|nr:uncharacterized protein E5676_scaffold177G00610 [Cucumis melo var. makuwa]
MQRNDALLTKPSHVNQESGVAIWAAGNRLEKIGDEKQSEKYLDILKELHIHISFVDALEQMPLYVKFLKDILAKKRRMNHYEIVALSQATRDVFNNGALEKMTDPRSFIIPCSIGGMDLGRAQCDLGASINLMSLSIFKKLGIGEVQPTQMTL